MSEKIYLNIPGTGTFELRNANGALFNPASVTLNIVGPTGSKTAVVPTNTGTGLYSYTYTPSEPGPHVVEVEGVTSGSITARGRGAFTVAPERF